MAQIKQTKAPIAGKEAPKAQPVTIVDEDDAAANAAKAAGAAIDWSEYGTESSGFTQVNPEDLGIAFIQIIQQKSPQIDVTHKDYNLKKIEGAAAGDVFNTVTKQILAKYDKGVITVVPCSYEKMFLEYKVNGGFVASHRNPAILNEVTGRDDKNKDILRNGNQLVTTMVFYVLLIQPGEKPIKAVISLSASQLKNGRAWLNLAMGIKTNGQTPPLFSHTYQLKTVIERKDNNSWFGWAISCGSELKPADKPLIIEAASIAKQVAAQSTAALKKLPAAAAVKELASGNSVADDEVPM